MGLLDRLFPKRDEPVSAEYFRLLNGYTPVFTSWHGSMYESELVRIAIDSRARHISKLKIETRGSAQPALCTKLRKAPNEFQVWPQFLYQVSTILDMKNTAFIVPVLNRYGEPVGIAPICPERWEIVQDKRGVLWLRFHYRNMQSNAMELHHVGILTKFQYTSEFFGESNHAMRDTMDLLKIQRQSIEESAKNSATYRFMAKMTNFAKDGDIAKERQRFDSENFKENGGGVLLFPSTYSDIQQLNAQSFSLSADQMKLIQDNVYRYFGTNEKVIQNEAKGDELDAFFNGAIEPFAIQLSEVMTKMFYTEQEQGYGNKVIVSANRLQYMTTSEKIALVRDLGDRGFIMIDEARELLNMPPLENGRGQVSPIRGEYYMVQDEPITADPQEAEQTGGDGE